MQDFITQNSSKKLNNVTEYLKVLPKFCVDYVCGLSSAAKLSTQLAYCTDIYNFLKYIVFNESKYNSLEVKDLPLEALLQITADDIKKYLEHLSCYTTGDNIYQNDNAAKARKWSTLKGLFQHFVKLGLLVYNPVLLVERPKIERRQVKVLDMEQVEKLKEIVLNPKGLTAHEKKMHGHIAYRDFAIVTLFAHTGIRVSELVGLNVNDINFEERHLRVTQENGNTRTINFDDAVFEALSNYLGYEPELDNEKALLPEVSPRDFLTIDKRKKEKVATDKNALFLSMRGARLTVRTVEVLIKKYGEMLGEDIKITPNALRDACGKEIYKQTGDVKLTAALMGHKDLNKAISFYM